MSSSLSDLAWCSLAKTHFKGTPHICASFHEPLPCLKPLPGPGSSYAVWDSLKLASKLDALPPPRFEKNTFLFWQLLTPGRQALWGTVPVQWLAPWTQTLSDLPLQFKLWARRQSLQLQSEHSHMGQQVRLQRQFRKHLVRGQGRQWWLGVGLCQTNLLMTCIHTTGSFYSSSYRVPSFSKPLIPSFPLSLSFPKHPLVSLAECHSLPWISLYFHSLASLLLTAMDSRLTTSKVKPEFLNGPSITISRALVFSPPVTCQSDWCLCLFHSSLWLLLNWKGILIW